MKIGFEEGRCHTVAKRPGGGHKAKKLPADGKGCSEARERGKAECGNSMVNKQPVLQ